MTVRSSTKTDLRFHTNTIFSIENKSKHSDWIAFCRFAWFPLKPFPSHVDDVEISWSIRSKFKYSETNSSSQGEKKTNLPIGRLSTTLRPLALARTAVTTQRWRRRRGVPLAFSLSSSLRRPLLAHPSAGRYLWSLRIAPIASSRTPPGPSAPPPSPPPPPHRMAALRREPASYTCTTRSRGRRSIFGRELLTGRSACTSAESRPTTTATSAMPARTSPLTSSTGQLVQLWSLLI